MDEIADTAANAAALVEADGGEAVVRVHVLPRAGRTAVTGRHGDALRVRVAAPPVEGRATEAARQALAGALGLPVARVTLVSGERSRHKRFRLQGVTRDDATRRVAGILAAPGRDRR